MGVDLLTINCCMSEHHYRKEMKRHAAEEAIQRVAKDKVHKLATKEYRLGKIAGRVKATQITDEDLIVIVKIMICICT